MTAVMARQFLVFTYPEPQTITTTWDATRGGCCVTEATCFGAPCALQRIDFCGRYLPCDFDMLI
jgi:hypothetical protein